MYVGMRGVEMDRTLTEHPMDEVRRASDARCSPVRSPRRRPSGSHARARDRFQRAGGSRMRPGSRTCIARRQLQANGPGVAPWLAVAAVRAEWNLRRAPTHGGALVGLGGNP